MVTYRIRKMIAWGMAVTMTAGMTNVLTGCGAEREGQAVETSQVEDTSQVMRIHRHGKNMPENLLR